VSLQTFTGDGRKSNSAIQAAKASAQRNQDLAERAENWLAALFSPVK